MSEVAQESRERIPRGHADKFAERREQLASSALQTLAELGYARTSLREIAQNSVFSHGVLHYYFSDKLDLIASAVRLFKSECVTRYDAVISGSTTALELRVGFGEAMSGTLQSDALMHRLWYDLRNQSLFEEAFRSEVFEIDTSLAAMIWRVVGRYTELAGAEPAVEEWIAYAMFDGLFRMFLLRYLAGDQSAPQVLATEAAAMLDRVVCRLPARSLS